LTKKAGFALQKIKSIKRGTQDSFHLHLRSHNWESIHSSSAFFRQKDGCICFHTSLNFSYKCQQDY